MWNPFRRRSSIRATLAQILERLNTMGNKFDDIITALNDGTNQVAARIDRLIAQLGNSATDAQLAELGAISDHLKSMGQDPANPIPTPPPAPPAA